MVPIWILGFSTIGVHGKDNENCGVLYAYIRCRVGISENMETAS